MHSWSRIVAFGFTVAACICSRPCIGAAPAPADALSTALNKIRSLNSYAVEFVRSDESGGVSSRHHRRIMYSRPSRYYIEDLEVLVQSTVAEGRKQTVCVPKMTTLVTQDVRWDYSREVRQYSRLSLDSQHEDPGVQFAPPMRLIESVSEVSNGGHEVLAIDGKRFDCEVIRAKAPPSVEFTFWIDTSTGFIVKHIARGPDRTVSVEILSIEVNPEIPPNLFIFEPAEGWRESSEYRCGSR